MKYGQIFTLKVGVEGGFFGRGFDRMGFIPGAQKPAPKPAPADGPPRIDTAYHGDRKSDAGRPGPAARAASPPWGEDIWRLTAAFQRPQRRASKADTDQLRQLWRADPDPGRTVAIHDELLAAVSAGSVRQNGDEALRDCPWSQVYVAVRQVTIGGVQLGRNEKFALQIGMAGGKFSRTINRLGLVRANG